jgi:hypothetical protein
VTTCVPGGGRLFGYSAFWAIERLPPVLPAAAPRPPPARECQAPRPLDRGGSGGRRHRRSQGKPSQGEDRGSEKQMGKAANAEHES